MKLEESLAAAKAEYEQKHLAMGYERWDDLPNWQKRDWLALYGYAVDEEE